ncbi:TetR/AcrR family transcriptional regulator [Mycolicibacterium cosmeticum]|nr:helix-turn-helix domain-containing protein [Mycolicibacterium cosmeticum]
MATMDGSAPRPPVVPATKPEQIRDAAMKCFADGGFAGTSLQTIADAADVSIGLIQHYFVTKRQLIESIDRHVLSVFGDALGVSPGATDVAVGASEAGSRFAELMHHNPEIMDYVGRALVEGGEVGKVIFDGLHAISEQQGVTFAAQGLTPDDLDSVWAAMLPLILRAGTIMLRPHIERHLQGSLYDWDATSRWDAAVTRLIQKGQFKPQ